MQKPDLLDHFIGEREQRWRHFKAERVGSFKINDQFELRRLLNWQVGGPRTTKNSAGISTGFPIIVGKISSLDNQIAGCCELPILIDRGHRMTQGQHGELLAPRVEECIGSDH
jgi:hypothetical protein